MTHYLRYRRTKDDGTPITDPRAACFRFGSIRYPWCHNVTPEKAEQMRQAMPEPDAFEIVEED